MPRLQEALGGSPRLLIKRDDQTGLATGGNKTRKLEFLVAEALAQGADTLVTVGGPQSNHCRQTAAAAAKLGLRCVLIVHGRGLNSPDSIPVLKERLPVWLNRGSARKIVLGFATARSYDGGTGAIYVLLRRRKVKISIFTLRLTPCAIIYLLLAIDRSDG